MSSIHIFHHREDMDGFTGGLIAYLYYKKHRPNDKIVLRPFTYEMNPSKDMLNQGDKVIFVDCSPQPLESIKEYQNLVGPENTLVIDHHATTIDFYTKNKITVHGLLDTENSGCYNAWKYFFGKEHPEVPEAITLLSAFDTWKKDRPDWETKILPFQYGIQSYVDDFANILEYKEGIWHALLFKDSPTVMQGVIDRGVDVLRFLRKMYKDEMSLNGFEATLDNRYFALCLNTNGNSLAFESKWDENRYDLMIAYVITDRGVDVSFYTTRNDIHVGSIAKEYGGGGHPQASGCHVKTISVNKSSKEIKLFK